ncbi:unnamed protein product [Arabidopsis arenosa]|uniref:Uncharacterized protein n=1 Tax=Arabidopsis arenosa TaxID=38785 RepID=A0A8S2ADI7_ARAAE|nr:unnamed protein product [Arabidopsis arenosa]
MALEFLNSSQLESGESMDFDNKIHEIKAMARRTREIEAGIELNQKEKHDINKETGDDDEDISMWSQDRLPDEVLTHSEVDDDKYESLGTSTESDQENIEQSLDKIFWPWQECWG